MCQVSPKITADEYVRSVRSCAPLAAAPEPMLRAAYASLLEHPLQLAPSVDRVDSVIRCGLEADREEGAVFSIYSSLGPGHGPGAAGSGGAAMSTALAAALQAQQMAAQRAAPRLDWRVAFWNTVDFCRWCRAATSRWLARLADAGSEAGAGWLLTWVGGAWLAAVAVGMAWLSR